MFNLDDIRAGYILKVHSTEGFTVLAGVNYNRYGALGVCAVPGQDHDLWCDLSEFDYSLTYSGENVYTIQAVYGRAFNADLMGHDGVTDRDLLWERKSEPEPREVTMSEVEKKFGCPVKIIR